jgi:hypothetical protein
VVEASVVVSVVVVSVVVLLSLVVSVVVEPQAAKDVTSMADASSVASSFFVVFMVHSPYHFKIFWIFCDPLIS